MSVDKNLEEQILDFLGTGKKNLTEISNHFWDKGHSGVKVDEGLANLLRDRKIQKVSEGFFSMPGDKTKYEILKPVKKSGVQYGTIEASDEERFKLMDARIRALEIRIAELEKKNEDR